MERIHLRYDTDGKEPTPENSVNSEDILTQQSHGAAFDLT